MSILMKYCGKCGNENESDANFCKKCGANLLSDKVNASLDANVNIVTTSLTIEKLFKALVGTFLSIIFFIKKLIKPVVILCLLGIFLFGLVYGGLFLYERSLRNAKESEISKIEKSIQIAQKNTSKSISIWKIGTEVDPASDRKIARNAFVTSNDGLCDLFLEKRIDGTNLTELFCEKFNLDSSKDVSIKFDTDEKLYTMDIRDFSNSDSVYIPSTQNDRFYNSIYDSGKVHLPYEDFVNKLQSSKAVAIKIYPTFDNGYEDFENPFSPRHSREEIKSNPFWMKFSLNNARISINKLGKEISE